MYLLAPFILQNKQKSLRADSELQRYAPFLGPKWPICPEQNVFGTNHCYYFHVPLALFIVHNLKKFLEQIQNYDDAPFLGPK